MSGAPGETDRGPDVGSRRIGSEHVEDLGAGPGPAPREPPSHDRPGRPAVWPLLLVVLAAGVAFLLQHVRPEEMTGRKPPKASAVSEVPKPKPKAEDADEAPFRDFDSDSPGRWVVYEKHRLKAADVVLNMLVVAGLVGLVAILSKKRRAWLAPPPSRAPRTGWGTVEFLQGLMLAVAFIMLSGELAKTLFPESLPGSYLMLFAMYACLAAAIVGLTAPHAAATGNKDAQDAQDTQDGESTSASSIEPQASCEPCPSLLKAAVRSLGFSLEGAWADALRGLVGGVIAFPVALVAALLAGVLCEALGIEPPVHPMIELAGTTTSALEIVVIFASGVIVVPLVEEFLFRGFIFASLRDRAGLAAGIIASSLLFSIVHLGLPNQAATFVLGAAFCLLYERTGTLVAPVVAHAYFNLAMLSMRLLQRFDV